MWTYNDIGKQSFWKNSVTHNYCFKMLFSFSRIMGIRRKQKQGVPNEGLEATGMKKEKI